MCCRLYFGRVACEKSTDLGKSRFCSIIEYSVQIERETAAPTNQQQSSTADERKAIQIASESETETESANETRWKSMNSRLEHSSYRQN